MQLPRAQMPIKTTAEVTLTAEEARLAATELRAKDLKGHQVHTLSSVIGERYSYSNYVVDPCRQSWTKSVRIMAIVLIFVNKCLAVVRREKEQVEDVAGSKLPSHLGAGAGSKLPARSVVVVKHADVLRLTSLSPNEIHAAENYFFKNGTDEVLRFTKPRDYRSCCELKDGILYFSGRLLDSGAVNALEEVMFDLNPVTFCGPCWIGSHQWLTPSCWRLTGQKSTT